MVLGIGAVVAAIGAERQVDLTSHYSTINVSAGVDVVLRPSSGKSYVTITGDAKKINRIKVAQKWGKLTITQEGTNTLSKINMRGVKVTVYGPAPTEVEASSGAEFECKDNLNYGSKNLTLEASSGAEIEMKSVVCSSLNVASSSGSSVSVDRAGVQTLKAVSTSGASVEVDNLKASKVEGNASSGAEIELEGVSQQAVLKASSAGEIDANKLQVFNPSVSTSSGGRVKVRK